MSKTKILCTLFVFLCYGKLFAQQPFKWTVRSCKKQFVINKNSTIDTLNYPLFLKNKTLKIKVDLDTSKSNNFNFFILVMDSSRQVLVKQLLKQNKTTITLQTVDSTIKHHIISLQYTQIPKDKELAKKIRVGTKIICYLKL